MRNDSSVAETFSTLAPRYEETRAGYSQQVMDEVLRFCGKPMRRLAAVDVGAGTGIWTRMMAKAGVRSIIAVEPNDSMRAEGRRASQAFPIVWRKDCGENTGLASSSADLVSWASSLHWVPLERGLGESIRILRPGGMFVAVWNTRLGGDQRVDEALNEWVMASERRRQTGCRSLDGLTLWRTLNESSELRDVHFLEAVEATQLTLGRYLDMLASAAHVRAALGGQSLAAFARGVTHGRSSEEQVEVSFATRAWIARKVGKS